MPIAIVPFALWLSLATAVYGESLSGMVTGVTDGDTLTMLDVQDGAHIARTVRLAGIDAPERGQAFGRVARHYLADAVFGREVVVQWEKRDRYGRILGKVLLGGSDVNLDIVRTGHAWVYRRYVKDLALTDREAYVLAEDEARTEGRGLWVDHMPVPPWEWRKRK